MNHGYKNDQATVFIIVDNLKNLDILKNSRLAMGLALFIIALSAGSLIAKEANRTVYVWASNGELAPGNTIASTDLKAVSVLLPESAKNYISTNVDCLTKLTIFLILVKDNIDWYNIPP